MNLPVRVAGWVADSSLLICFGAIPAGPRLLNDAYSGSVGVTPTVRAELDRIALHGSASPRKIAAAVFTGRGRDKLVSIEFQRCDETERATALHHISTKSVPENGPAPIDGSELGREPGDSPKEGEHAGEAESIAVALRTQMPLLMTDGDGTKYAEQRGLSVESFTRALVRLAPTIPANSLFQMWRNVSRDHGTGPEVVTGAAYFRMPKRSLR